MKKSISILLSLLMVVSTFSFVSIFSVSAEGTETKSVIFDAADPKLYPNPFRSAAWDVNNPQNYIVTKGDRKVLKITRDKEYDNISAEFVTDLSGVAPKAEKLQIWLAGDENAMLTTSVKGGFSFGFQTNDGNFYFASNGTDCSYNITTDGAVYSVDLSTLKVMQANVSSWTNASGVVYSNRISGIKDWTKLDFSTIADKLASVILNFGSIQSISPAAYKGTSFYVDDLEFVGGTIAPAKTITVDGVKTEFSGDKFTLPVSTKDGFIAYTDGTNYYDQNTKVDVTGDTTFTSVAIGSVQMLDGSAIRLGNISGMRFYTTIDADALSALPNDAVVSKGTLITPVDLLGNEELTLDATCQKLDIPYKAATYFENNNTFVGSIVRIKDANITREFVGRGYVKVTLGSITKTVYANYKDNNIKNNTRSIAYIANTYAKTSDYASLSDELKQIVDNWAEKYVKPAGNIDFEDNDASMVTLVGTDVSAEIVDKNNSKMLCVKHTTKWDYLGPDNYARIAVDATDGSDITFDAFYEGWASKAAHYGVEINGVQYWDQPWDGGSINKTSATFSLAGKTLSQLNGKFGVSGLSTINIDSSNISKIDAILIRPINNQQGQLVYVDNIKVVK